MSSESNHDYRVKMNVIDYITITCNLKNGRLQITSDYMKKCNRLQLITITPCLVEVPSDEGKDINNK